jgi:hypothetical protein
MAKDHWDNMYDDACRDFQKDQRQQSITHSLLIAGLLVFFAGYGWAVGTILEHIPETVNTFLRVGS